MAPDYVVFSSYGNDSIALLQLLTRYRLPEQRACAVVYSDTGWASPDWEDRVARAEAWARGLGFSVHRTAAEGFAQLIKRKKMFPRGRAQFCTSVLKIEPAQHWLAEHDPEARAVCVVGVRRAESLRRSGAQAYEPISAAHGGRPLWQPMVEFTNADRDNVVLAAGWDVLPHRSDECFPCIFSARKDLRRVTEERVAEIEGLERRCAADGSRTMFRPAAYAGARGVREVMRWAHSERGAYRAEHDDEADCDSGFCGT